MIDDYLSALRRLLPWAIRRRVLAEVEDHLRSSADAHGEAEAVARFGSPRELAAGLATIHVRAAIATAVAFTAVLLAVPLAAYVVTENSLPPAPWPEGAMPATLAWKVHATTALYGFALAAFAAAGTLVFFRRAAGAVLVALAAAAAAVATMGAIGCALSLEWADAVAGTPRSLAAFGVAQALVALVSTAVVAEAGQFVRRARAAASE